LLSRVRWKWNSERALKILATPSEQQVGVNVIATCNQRYRRAGLKGLNGELPFELSWKVRALTGRRASAIDYLGHFGSHQNIWWEPNYLPSSKYGERPS
jgi:hypothetical protein